MFSALETAKINAIKHKISFFCKFIFA